MNQLAWLKFGVHLNNPKKGKCQIKTRVTEKSLRRTLELKSSSQIHQSIQGDCCTIPFLIYIINDNITTEFQRTFRPQFDALMNNSKSSQFLSVSCGQTLQNNLTVFVSVQSLHRGYVHLPLIFFIDRVDREVFVVHVFYQER